MRLRAFGKSGNGMRRRGKAILLILASILLLVPLGCTVPGTQPGSPSASAGGTAEPSASGPASPEVSTPTDSVPVVGPTGEPSPVTADYQYDVLVYGGTPAGVMAAVAASREGLKVAILEPSKHIGGVVTGGLGYSDVGNTNVIGGLARDFFKWTGLYYTQQYSSFYPIEPHFAEQIFYLWLVSAKVDIYQEYRLRETGGVQKNGNTIACVTTEDGTVFAAKSFIDCSYEGDLMAMSGISYTVGREAQDRYHETLAGVRPFTYTNNFTYSLSPYSASRELLMGISNELPAEVGKGDNKVPAYNFRLCITNNTENQVPFEKPDNYDPSQYELLLRWLLLLKSSEGNRDLRITDVFSLGSLPNAKYDANNLGPVSSDFIGQSWAYPDADYEIREDIISQHKAYLQGMLYFLENDTRVPVELREDMAKWGLAKDEFADNDNWPYQLYIREARRMVGDFVMTQKDLQTDRDKPDSIGMASYAIDSHNVQRIISENRYALNEGEVQIPVLPYQLPYRIMLPKEKEANNLLVPVCVSASHVAYSSIRMEPQFMILGQAAGLAAYLAISQSCSVQAVSTDQLQAQLENRGAILSLP